MFVRSLELSTFRGWKSAHLDFDGGPVALLGGNAVGKTSFVEAIWYAASLGSHRTSTDSVMVQDGEHAAVIRVDVQKGPRSELIELEIVTKGRARAKLGGGNVPRRRDVLGAVRATIFAPERQSVIRGDPGDRRRFVDELLVQLSPRYHAVIREYERALRQRNTLLREHAQGKRGLAGIEAWDEALIGPGAELTAGRARAIARLEPHARAGFDAVGGGAAFGVRYEPSVPEPEPTLADPGPVADVSAWAERFRARLAERHQDEVIRGVTLVGPHRDEVAVSVAGLPARTHSSHGEGWLAAVALVLGAHAAVADVIDDQPVLLLDDPFTLLDPGRRIKLVGALPEGAQIIVTAADPAEVPPEMNATTIDVEGMKDAS